MLSLATRKWAVSLALVAGVTFLCGCPDTEGKFNDFADRYQKTYPSSGAGGASGCMTPPAMAGDGDGTFLFTLSPSISRRTPILFDAQLAVSAGGMGLEFSLTLHALDATDRMTLVGDSFTIGPFAIGADGAIDADLPQLDVDGAANPITAGNDISADVDLVGFICAEDFMCGVANGITVVPPGIGLEGSTWTLERLAMPGVYPDPPKINCAGDPADPPESM